MEKVIGAVMVALALSACQDFRPPPPNPALAGLGAALANPNPYYTPPPAPAAPMRTQCQRFPSGQVECRSMP